MMPTANTSAGALETLCRIVGIVFHQIDHRKIVVCPASTELPHSLKQAWAQQTHGHSSIDEEPRGRCILVDCWTTGTSPYPHERSIDTSTSSHLIGPSSCDYLVRKQSLSTYTIDPRFDQRETHDVDMFLSQSIVTNLSHI